VCVCVDGASFLSRCVCLVSLELDQSSNGWNLRPLSGLCVCGGAGVGYIIDIKLVLYCVFIFL